MLANLTELVDEFIVSREAIDLSPETCKWYRRMLRGFTTWAGDRPLEISTLRAYLASRREVGWANASLRGAARTLKIWCRWLHEEGYADEDLGQRLAMPKRAQVRPRVVSVGEFQRMLKACHGSTLTHLRNRALVLFLADTGCRIGELPPMRWSDIVGHVVRVTGKGGKMRVVYLSPATLVALEAMRALHPDSEIVWWGHKGPMTRDGLYQAIKRLAHRAGCAGPTNPHAFRHFFATRMVANGSDLETVRCLLGHADISTTLIYVQLAQAEIEAKHRQYSPVRRLTD